MARNLEQIIDALDSSKIRERANGVELLNSFLAVPNRAEKLDSQDLLLLLRALFSAFSSEKAAYTKKGASSSTATAENRLKTVAKALRGLVEQTYRQWSKRVLRVALEHLFEHCKDRGALFEPVALDYFHTLAQILRFQAHVDNIEHEKWLKLVDLMFNVILEESFKSRLEDPFEPKSRSPSPMEVDEEGEEDEMSSSATRKRKRPESTPAPRFHNACSKGAGAEVGQIKPVAAEILGSLLRSPSAPLVSADYPFMIPAVFNRIQRYLAMYSNKASLHRELLPALSAVLSSCALNSAAVVARFARDAWSDIVDLWKIKDWREPIVAIVCKLFPYLTVENNALGPLPPYEPGLRALYDCLEKDTHEARTKALSLDCIRMELLPETAAPDAFVAKTYRHGWKFTSAQALTWALLELRADCAAKLYYLSRSTLHPQDAGRKRVKREDPITELLSCVRTRADINTRISHLQQLLFVIDRHWSIIHNELRQSIKDALVQFLANDEPDIQSWTFMCLAAIAHSTSAEDTPSPWWDDIWTHATREVTIPRVCRAACHLAHTLLTRARSLISPNKIFSDIEALAKDLTIQGPIFPYDSVCTFLVSSIRIASQDVRLYRLQLEEKALSWLLKSWKPTDPLDRAKMPAHTVQDIHHLLEVICGARVQVKLISEMQLPESSIVDMVIEEHATAVIRDFALYARLPPFKPISAANTHLSSFGTSKTDQKVETSPGGKERRLSSFYTTHLEKFIEEGDRESKARVPHIERVRVALDFAISALCFETMVSVGGCTPNKRTMQLACQVILLFIPLAADPRTTSWEDRLLILAALDPLVLAAPRKGVDKPWEAMLPPGRSSGIRRDILRKLSTEADLVLRHASEIRRQFQRRILGNVESAMDSAIGEILDIMRRCLADVSQTLPTPSNPEAKKSMDDNRIQLTNDSRGPVNARAMILRKVVSACIGALATIPMLHSGQPTRETKLFKLFDGCSSPSFILFATIYAGHLRDGSLDLNITNLLQLLEYVADVAGYYVCKQDDAFRIMAVSLIGATLRIWMDGVVDDDARRQVRHLFQWVYTMGRNHGNISWRVADTIVQFLDDYMREDPSEALWPLADEEQSEAPHSWLHSFAGHADIRVRFRAVLASTRSFPIIQHLRMKPMDWYLSIRGELSTDSDAYEQMLTRLVCLGNVMVVSSAVRRGSYWNLLEICLYSLVHVAHVETILIAVSQRLGLSVASFFETYAGQIGIALRINDHDFLKIPPHLLGYTDRMEYAKAVFPLFTPHNLAASGQDPDQEERGRAFFKTHCEVLKKSTEEGLEECLANVVGNYIAHFVSANDGVLDDGSTDLLSSLQKLFTYFGSPVPDRQRLRPCADVIVTVILRTLGEADCSPSGSVIKAMKESSEASPETFSSLTQFRDDSFYDEEAIIPAWPARLVFTAIKWFNDHLVPHYTDEALTLHVLHHLFAITERHPIVYEQLRLLNAVSVWVAWRQDHFRSPTLLEALFYGALNILVQADLARGAQSILSWIFDRLDQYRSSELNLRLAEGLLRVGCIAHAYAVDDASDISLMGEEILQWIEQRIQGIYGIQGRERAVLEALAAWPRDLNDSLKQLCGPISAEDLSQYLRDDDISTNKFRLVRRLHELTAEGPNDTHQFARSDFWKLKSCIPPRNSLALNDVHAFTEILLSNHGHIDGLEYEAPGAPLARLQHIKSVSRETSYHEAQLGVRRAIFVSLLNILRDPSTPRAYIAFQTVRSLAAMTATDALGSSSWPSGHKGELSYLQAFSGSFPPPSSTSLNDSLAAEHAQVFARDFPEWVKFVASTICNFLAMGESFFAPLSAALLRDTVLAEEILPILVHAALRREWEQRKTQAEAAPTRLTLSKYFTSVLDSSSTSVSCRRVIVDIVLHLRQMKPLDEKDPLSRERWLDIDYLLLSQSAIAYGAYTTALMFTELAPDCSASFSSQSSAVEQVLYEIYSHIDEPDGFYGITSQDPHTALLKRFHHESQWQKAFQFHGASMDDHFSEGDDIQGVLHALHSFGFNQLALTTLRAVPDASSSLTSGSMAYDLGWRTGTWDLPEHPGHQRAALYNALRAVHRERDEAIVEGILERNLTDEMSRLRSLADENITEIREVGQNLLCLNEVRRWITGDSSRRQQSRSADLISSIGLIDANEDIEYSILEALTATRVSLLHSARYKEERDQIGDIRSPIVQNLVDVETDCLLRLSQASRKVGNIQIALNSVVRAQKLCLSPRFDVSEEYAHVLWLSNEPRSAVQYLHALLNTPESRAIITGAVNAVKQALVYATLGTWASEAHLEKPADIKVRYFDKAVELIKQQAKSMSAKDVSHHVSVLHQYAIFAERQYTSIVKSPDVLRWRVYVGRKEEEVRQLGDRIRHADGGSLRELSKMQTRAKKLLAEDRSRLQEYDTQRDTFLRQALDMYSRTLQKADDFDDDSIIRFCSLWFANFDCTEGDFQPFIAKVLDRIPSRKFVFLTHQLTARLSKSDKQPSSRHPTQQSNLRSVVLRMCREHPFHTLYSVFCLQSDNNASRRQSTRLEPTSSQTERVAAAVDIFQTLRSDRSTQTRVNNVELVCRASLQWAQYPIKAEYDAASKAGRPKPTQVPARLQILAIKDIKVPVITAALPIDATCRYDDCVWISRYEDRFATAGGVNVPKITNCIGSDGCAYKQLYKGEGSDDLRQDAVMEQVFDLVNILLQRDRHTMQRKLRIRGYKVIPLSSLSGVLEFVQNTSPLRSWLEPAHKRYRPQDISSAQFINALVNIQKNGNTGDTNLHERVAEKFTQLRTKFKPVMRHFFTEHHKVPIVWFRTRLNYARSVATTSIVGWVLGLGDRHTSNILQDETTGEVVHIDLGIAFEQGKLLPVPERVPFRLTADVIDGLGTSGVDGVFRRCSEETLRVLREEHEVILTVLEVFKYDPLHSWTASEVKLKQAQSRTEAASELTEAAFKFATGLDMSAGTADEAADRALGSVQRKLDKTNSVEFTVNDLIQQATDPFNLANMYCGWSPHL